MLDFRMSELCGSRPSLDLQCDTRTPLNLEDSDLSLDMTELPPERTEITEMVIILIKCHFGDFLKTAFPVMSLDSLRRSDMSLFAKDELTKKLQDSLEQKFLRYCDPLQPLHLLALIFCRTAINKMKLSVHNPFQYTNKGISIPPAESEIILDTGMKVLESGNMLFSTSSLQRFQWYLGANFLWDSYIYTLVELRRRKSGPKVDRAWGQIDLLFENYPQVVSEIGNPLYIAVGIWTLRVWEECAAARAGGPPETPEYIKQLRRNRPKSSSSSPEFFPSVPKDPAVFGGSLLDYDRVGFLNQPLDMNPNSTFDLDSLKTTDMMFFESFAMDWAQLDSLIRTSQ
jgi:hypothetical protein